MWKYKSDKNISLKGKRPLLFVSPYIAFVTKMKKLTKNT